LGEEMYGVSSRGFQIKRKNKEDQREVAEMDCQACKLNKEDVKDRSSWRKLRSLMIRMGVSG